MKLKIVAGFRPKLNYVGLLVLTVLMAGLVSACGDEATATPAASATTAKAATTAAATTAATGTTAVAGAATTAAATSGGTTASSLGPIAKGPAQLGGTVVIALNTEITGAGAQTGDLARKAAVIAQEKINAAGGINGAKIDLIIEDAASSNQGALAALNKAGEDKAVVMVGPVKSTQIQAISERIKELQMISLIGGTNRGLTKAGNPYLFRFRPDDSIAATAMVNYSLTDLKASKIAVLHDSDAFGTGGADIIEEGLKKAGKSFATRQKYSTGTQDYTAQLLAIKNSGADVLCIYGTNASDDAIMLRQIKELGFKIPVLGSPSFGQTVVFDLNAELTDGVYVVQDYFAGRTPEYEEYAAAWKAKYPGTTIDGLSAWNWDAMHLFSQIIAQVGTDKAKIQTALLATKGWKGSAGSFNFVAEGNGRDSVDIAQYKSKALNFVKTVSAN